MRRAILFLLIPILAGCAGEPAVTPAENEESSRLEYERPMAGGGRVVVANRGSGTVSVIDARSGVVLDTPALPAGDAAPEPMYVMATAPHHRVFVGDRANDRVVAFDARTFEVDGTVACGAGVFHMWADPQGKQLWVNNDIDNTTTVVDPKSLTVIATVPTPADLVAAGGKPHDVIVGPNGNFAYVTVLGVAGANDYVVQFDTESFTERARAAVGQDPHVSLARQHDRLYIPCQNSDVVVVLNRFTLDPITTLDVPGAHGAGMSRNGRVFYTANLPGGGTDALFAIDTETNERIGDAVNSPYPVPHNLALNSSGRRLFLTHSGGTSDKVTIYDVDAAGVPTFASEVTVGLNPFGLAYVQ